METLLTTGERLAVPERVIVAPATGRFRPVSAVGGPHGPNGDGDGPNGDGADGDGADGDGADGDGADGDGAGPAADTVVLYPHQVIGHVEGTGSSTPVTSPFRGLFMGLMAHDGERVREGQPVAWLRLA